MAIKDGLLYLFRYETDTNEKGRPKRQTVGHVDQREAAPITLPSEPITMREALRLSLEVLPNSWRATVFPDRVILYREKVDNRYARECLEG